MDNAAGTGLVSVVMPAYNAAAFIRPALESVLHQTYQNFEIVVVEDGSKETVEWVVDLDPDRIRYVVKENGGPASARNRGVRESSGEFVAFLDSDDLWEPEKLALQVEALRTNPEAAFCYGPHRSVDEHGNLREDHREPGPSGDIAEVMFMKNLVTNSTVMIRRALFNELGGYEESLIVAEDYDLWLRLCEKHPAVCVPHSLARYRIHAGGISRNTDRMLAGEKRVIDRALERNVRPEFSRRISERLGRLYHDAAYLYGRAGRRAEARRYYALSLRHWPRDRLVWRGCARAFLPGLLDQVMSRALLKLGLKRT